MKTLVVRLLTMAPEARRGTAALVALALGVTATYVAQGILIARVLAEVFTGGGAGTVVWQAVGIAALQAVRAGLFATRDALSYRVSGLLKAAVRDRLTRKLFELGPGALQGDRTGRVQSITVDAVEMIDPLAGQFVPQALATLIGAPIVTAYVVWLDPLVGSIILACALIAPAVVVRQARSFREVGDAWSGSYREFMAESLDAVQGMPTLKAFNASRRRGVALQQEAAAFCRDSIAFTVQFCKSAGLGELAIPLGSAAAVGLGALHATQGSLSLAELFTILLLSRECFRPLADLYTAYAHAYSALPASTEIFAMLDRPADIRDAAGPVKPDSGVGVGGPGPPAVVFEDVRFAYRGRVHPALEGFTLHVGPGERVAIVGPSGAGKTTVVSLLLRFFDLDAGRILVGGRDARELSLARLREMVGVVSQDTYLFHGTVADNLRLGRADADPDEIEAAARAARAHGFITDLPHGYDTVVGERGLTLSGGQRQRIAIARALLKDASILVLDEPTSSVDAANEAEIQRELDELTRGRTTLVVAHRLSTVRDADRIVVLAAGRVVEVGPHADLMARNGVYADLVAAQAGATS